MLAVSNVYAKGDYVLIQYTRDPLQQSRVFWALIPGHFYLAYMTLWLVQPNGLIELNICNCTFNYAYLCATKIVSGKKKKK